MGAEVIPVRCRCGTTFSVPADPPPIVVSCPSCDAIVPAKRAEEPKPEPAPAPTTTAAPADESPNLGKIVVEKGWVTAEKLGEAVKAQGEAAAKGERLRLGEVLIQMALVTPDQLREALATQDKIPLRCPTCNKLFNVKAFKPGTRVLCKTCRVPLVPAGAITNVPISDTNHGLGRSPAGDAVDASLADLIPGYKIERKLGSGGMGDVYLARQASLDRFVAIKLLPVDQAKNTSFVERFVTEARSAGRVIHENIVGAIDAGESKGRYYFVMEYVQGETVQQIVRRDGAIPEKRALEIARQVAKGLRHAHKQGLIHRDIKPANLMVTVDGTAKICDFGLARDTKTDVTTTMPGFVQSSPAYASPEQCRGVQNLDHRTDMYSLGVSLFEMLTAKRPFMGETSSALFIAHATQAPPAPKSMNPAISAGANQLVLRLLRKEPERRFNDYDELIGAIDQLLEDPAKANTPKTAAAPTPFYLQPKFKYGAIAAAVVIVLVIVFVATSGGGPKPEEEAKPAKVETEADRLLRETHAQEKRAAGKPSEIPAIRERWRQLAERYRGSPQGDRFAGALLAFEAEVASDAKVVAARALSEVDVRLAAGRPVDALQLIRGFPAGYEGTESATKVAARAVEVERALDEQVKGQKEKVSELIAQKKFDEARRQTEALRATVSAEGPEGPVVVRPQDREDVDNLIARIQEDQLLAKKKESEPAAAPKDAPPAKPGPSKPADPAPPASTPDYVLVLRTAAERTNPEKRSAAAEAFGRDASRSALFRAAEVFLRRDERAWKLVADRLKLKTEQIDFDLEGQATAVDKESVLFRANNGTRIQLHKDGTASINGAAPVKPLKNELSRAVQSPLAKALDEYLAAAPLERAEALSPAEHQIYIQMIGKKMATLGDAPADVLQLFACAHAEDILNKKSRVDAEAMRGVRLQYAKAADLIGPGEAANRIALARLVLKPTTPLEVKRAADAAVEHTDIGTRVLRALAAFAEPTIDPVTSSASWKSIATLAPETAAAKFADLVAQKLKEASACGECQAQGKYPCKKCKATGLADCEKCKGTGRIDEPGSKSGFSNGSIPCPDCKQKGKFICPECQGGKVARCKTCEGKRVKRSIPAGDFRTYAEQNLCPACQGGASVFGRVAFPCPSCDGLGRFAK